MDGELGPRQHRPAFEVVFVYCRKEGSLDVNFPGPHRALEPLQEMFAAAILKLDRLARSGSERVYDLDPLLRRDFQFVCGRGSGIEAVAVRLLRLSVAGEKGRPDHAGSRRLHPPGRDPRRSGARRQVHPPALVQRHPGGAGGPGSDGWEQTSREGADLSDRTRFLLPRLRGAGPEAAVDAEGLRPRTCKRQRGPGDESGSRPARSGRAGMRLPRTGRPDRLPRAGPVAPGGGRGPEVAEAPQKGAACPQHSL